MSKIRLDRALTLGLVHPAVRLLNGHRQRRVPILMYHGIRDGIGTKHPYFETNTSPGLFSRHLQYLCDHGYTAVNLGDAVETLETGSDVKRPVVITFDDGYRDFYTHAFPVLAERGLRATVFVVSDKTSDERICSDGKDYMTWKEVREIHSHGIQIGSHTATHPELYGLSLLKVEDEIRQSKETIENELGAPVSSFSYPFAFPEHDKKFVGALVGFLEKHEYKIGVSTIIGTATHGSSRFFLPRLPVNSYDDLPLFRAKLEGGYDWLHTFQYLTKTVKHRLSVKTDRKPESSIAVGQG
jgi:peptidoglycan/xylan/chitin deacetylase (PgdA/CDA1 family)